MSSLPLFLQLKPSDDESLAAAVRTCQRLADALVVCPAGREADRELGRAEALAQAAASALFALAGQPRTKAQRRYVRAVARAQYAYGRSVLEAAQDLADREGPALTAQRPRKRLADHGQRAGGAALRPAPSAAP